MLWLRIWIQWFDKRQDKTRESCYFLRGLVFDSLSIFIGDANRQLLVQYDNVYQDWGSNAKAKRDRDGDISFLKHDFMAPVKVQSPFPTALPYGSNGPEHKRLSEICMRDLGDVE